MYRISLFSITLDAAERKAFSSASGWEDRKVQAALGQCPDTMERPSTRHGAGQERLCKGKAVQTISVQHFVTAEALFSLWNPSSQYA